MGKSVLIQQCLGRFVSQQQQLMRARILASASTNTENGGVSRRVLFAKCNGDAFTTDGTFDMLGEMVMQV